MISSLECFGFPVGFLHQLLQEDELVAVGVSVCVWQHGARLVGVNTCLMAQLPSSDPQLLAVGVSGLSPSPFASRTQQLLCEAVCQYCSSLADSPSPCGLCPVPLKLGSCLSFQPLCTCPVYQLPGHGQIPIPKEFCSPDTLKWVTRKTEVCSPHELCEHAVSCIASSWPVGAYPRLSLGSNGLCAHKRLCQSCIIIPQ